MRFLSFFSFAMLTQLILLLNQVVLLPIQLRVWGTAATASWYAGIALATITTFADLGLRTAGHVELLRFVNDHDESQGLYIKQVWAWIRMLVCGTTALLLAWLLVQGMFWGQRGEALWKCGLTVAYAMETLLIVRIVFLDSLGHYSAAECTYFVFASIRLGLALPGIWILHLQPAGLSAIFVASSAVGLVLQGRLCRGLGVLGLPDALPRRLSLAVLATARHTMAEPLSNWLRISLPVLVITELSTPVAVTTFVALRAVFGALRTTIQQVARVASVEYLRIQAAHRTAQARAVLIGFVQGATFLGAAIGGVVIVDNLRILGLWLKDFDPGIFHMMVASFALSGAFYAYQIFVSVMFRGGELAAVAGRQYAFVAYSGLIAAIALLAHSLSAYLYMIVTSEALLAATFMLRRGGATNDHWLAGKRGLLAAVGGVAMLSVLCVAVQRDYNGIFIRVSSMAAFASVLALVTLAAALATLLTLLNADLVWPSRRTCLRSTLES